MINTDTQLNIDSYIKVSRENICRRIGYSPDAEPSPRIASLLDDYMENAWHLIDPVYSYTILDIKHIQNSTITMGNSTVFHSQVISQVLDQCSKAAIFVLTIGHQIEETAAELADDNQIVESYVLDAIGSGIAEKLAEFVQGVIGEIGHIHGLTTTRRFSPGYCDWDISQQEVVFRSLNGDLAGVHLSDDYLMVPQKSISGIIGLGPRENGVRAINPCKTCNKRNCLGRR